MWDGESSCACFSSLVSASAWLHVSTFLSIYLQFVFGSCWDSCGCWRHSWPAVPWAPLVHFTYSCHTSVYQPAPSKLTSEIHCAPPRPLDQHSLGRCWPCFCRANIRVLWTSSMGFSLCISLWSKLDSRGAPLFEYLNEFWPSWNQNRAGFPLVSSVTWHKKWIVQTESCPPLLLRGSSFPVVHFTVHWGAEAIWHIKERMNGFAWPQDPVTAPALEIPLQGVRGLGVWREETAFPDKLEALCIEYLWRLAGKSKQAGTGCLPSIRAKLSLSVEDAKFWQRERNR